MDPTKDSWPVLNRWAITDNMTTPKADKTVQAQAFVALKDGIIVSYGTEGGRKTGGKRFDILIQRVSWSMALTILGSCNVLKLQPRSSSCKGRF